MLHLIITTVLGVCVALLSIAIYILRGKIVELNSQVEEKKERNKKVLSQKKSSEVRTGHILEKLAPFMDDFDYNIRELQFLGNPIDFISFGEDEITFIEVKSGKARLSKKQRKIRDMINNKQVAWDVYRK